MRSLINRRQALLIGLFVYLFIGLLPARAQEATPGAADSIRERVREKVESIIRQPRALVGTLTEITDSTLQIKTKAGEIALASTDEETSFVRLVRGRRSQVSFEDLVLGDFTVVMGFRNGNDVLEARRIITYDTSPLVERRAVFGVVQGNEAGTLTLQLPKTAEVWTVETDRDTTITKKGVDGFEEIDVDEVQVGDKLVAAGIPDEDEENTLLAGRIHIIAQQDQ